MPQFLPYNNINCITITIITIIFYVSIISINILPYYTLLVFANIIIAV